MCGWLVTARVLASEKYVEQWNKEQRTRARKMRSTKTSEVGTPKASAAPSTMPAKTAWTTPRHIDMPFPLAEPSTGICDVPGCSVCIELARVKAVSQ
jgi:hypothetical protein